MPLFQHHPIRNVGPRMGVTTPGVEKMAFTATLNEIIAGTQILDKIPGFKYVVHDFLLIFAGNAATAIDIRLSSNNATPVDIVTVAVANAGDGDKRAPADATAVLGAGFNAELGSGDGVQIRETGNTLTGTTSVTGWIEYQLVQG